MGGHTNHHGWFTRHFYRSARDNNSLSIFITTCNIVGSVCALCQLDVARNKMDDYTRAPWGNCKAVIESLSTPKSECGQGWLPRWSMYAGMHALWVGQWTHFDDDEVLATIGILRTSRVAPTLVASNGVRHPELNTGLQGRYSSV